MSLPRLASVPNPNFPTVKAMAAKAASGARYMIIRTTPNTAWVNSSINTTVR
jgi:hypothetical protein